MFGRVLNTSLHDTGSSEYCMIGGAEYWKTLKYRDGHWQMFFKKGVLKNVGKFTWKHLRWSLYEILWKFYGNVGNFMKLFLKEHL